MIILGINAYHGDSSACLVAEGKLIAAAEEERFRRVKHWAGFPSESIQYCLQEAGVKVQEVDHIALNRNPHAHFCRKVLFTMGRRPSLKLVKDRLHNAHQIQDIHSKVSGEFQIDPFELKAKIHHVEHHLAHLASSFFVSPFDEAAVVSVDGFGDFVGAMWGMGQDNQIKVEDRIFFPHSLGLFYLAFTQYLGFPRYGDEYKVMGMAGYGEPTHLPQMRRIVHLNSQGHFRLIRDYFLHQGDGAVMAWDGGEPKMGAVYSPRLEDLLGPARSPGEPVEREHLNIAASLQATYEEAFFHLLNQVYEKTKISNLCLAGGCALNSVANGKIFDRTPFKEVYIQPAAGDGGGALGAAYYVWNQIEHQKRTFVMKRAYWGPEFDEKRIEEELDEKKKELEQNHCSIEKSPNQDWLCQKVAAEISAGKIIGWFQGRMEWGPRALGNRSILVDPRRAEMKQILNERIKRRESFRPFAPSILRERIGEYFEKSYPDPFMVKVYPVRPEKRALIPAVVHADGTGRLQTVDREENPLYWHLIKEFEKQTGVPLLLNTSFNENEPIVCTPREAIDCFLRMKGDMLVLGQWVIRRMKEDKSREAGKKI